MTEPFLLSILVFVLVFFMVPCGRLSWLCQLLSARKYNASYHIVSYRIVVSFVFKF